MCEDTLTNMYDNFFLDFSLYLDSCHVKVSLHDGTTSMLIHLFSQQYMEVEKIGRARKIRYKAIILYNTSM